MLRAYLVVAVYFFILLKIIFQVYWEIINIHHCVSLRYTESWIHLHILWNNIMTIHLINTHVSHLDIVRRKEKIFSLWWEFLRTTLNNLTIYDAGVLTTVVMLYITFIVVVQSLSRVQLFSTPWTAARQVPLCPGSLLKFISIESVMLSNHLIHYIHSAYLFYTWKFVHFYYHLSSPPSPQCSFLYYGNHQSDILFHQLKKKKLDSTCKWNHAVFFFFCLTFHLAECLQGPSMLPQIVGFSYFYGWMIFHCVYVCVYNFFIHSFIKGHLFSYLVYYK